MWIRDSSIIKRTLSGTLEKNLIDISFTTEQVVDGEEHKLLMALRNSSLKDEKAVQTFFQRVIENLVIEGNYLILLAHDTYDIPYRSRDGALQDDASDDVFSYILCSICPIKPTKPALSYFIAENEFHDIKADWLVSAPELGFMFPAFDDRTANIYDALYYTKNIQENHTEFIDTLFKSELPMPAAEQKEVFESLLGNTLADECNYEVMQSVHEQLSEMVEENKADKEADPLILSKNTVKNVLKTCGVSENNIETFNEKYDTEFGAETGLSPQNIIDTKKFELHTPDVTIQVKPDRSDLIETRIIDGKKYILIRVEEGVEVNGVDINIS
ncbi:MAG TPA: hypothetical protein DEP42_03060 [Ruminococcaceae bacterium]|nr:hypothetical protein [Oscillospiraceae bacterium]